MKHLALLVFLAASAVAAVDTRIKDIATTATTPAATDYVAIDSTANGTRKILATSLVPTVNANPGTVGNATTVPRITVNAKGQVTSVTPIEITGGSTAGVTKNSSLTSGYILVGGGDGVLGPSGIQVTGNNNVSLGNVVAGEFSPTAVTGATANGQLLIGNATSGNFTKAVPTAASTGGATVTLGGGTIEIGSTDARNFIVGNVTITTNSTGNLTFTAGDNVTLTGNNTNKSITVNATGGGGGGAALSDGMATLWPTAGVGSLPSGYFEAGQYGSAAQTALGDWSIIVKSAGTVADPTVDIAPGTVASGTVVTFSSTTPSLTNFRVTTNGTDPSYTVGTAGNTITVTANNTYEVIANKQGYVSSSVQSFAYTVASSGPSLVSSLGEGAAAGGDGFTSSSITTTGANLIVVVKTWYGGSEPTLTDSKSNTWVANGAAQSDNGVARWIRHYYVYGGTVGTGHTFTLGGTAHYGAIAVLAFSGMAASPADQSAGDEEVAWTTHPSGSITPSQANSVSVTGLTFDSGSGTITEPSGYTAGPEVMTSGGAHIGISVAWKALTATTPINPDWSSSSAYLFGATKHANYKY